jgi:uncharacterized protein
VPEPISPTAPPLRLPWLRQQWRDVAFVHWAVEPGTVTRFLPPGVEPDVLDGRTYVGLVAFRMVGAGFTRGPAVPWAGTFLETNVRLYSVDATGRHGVVFLSLDADRAAVVAAARVGLGLPYRWARMRFARCGPERTYTARLRWPGSSARSHLAVRAGTEVLDGPLDRFLTARWGLHVAHLGRTWYVPNTHEQWPLRAAELIDLDDGLLASVGLAGTAERAPDHVAFSAGVSVTFGRPVPASTPRSG